MTTKTTQDYEQARASAQLAANKYGYDVGLQLHAWGYHHFLLPRRESRYGIELRCEVVSPECIERTQPGHGSAK